MAGFSLLIEQRKLSNAVEHVKKLGSGSIAKLVPVQGIKC